MRKYLQLIVVLVIFSSAVLVRQLREQALRPLPGLEPASALVSRASLRASPSLQPVAAEAAVPRETTPSTPQPAPAVATASEATVTPTATAPAIEIATPPTAIAPAVAATPPPAATLAIDATPTPTATPNPTPTPAMPKWPTLFEGSVFKDGEFTGKPSRTSYGEVQVAVVMRSGRIEDVLIVEFPDRTLTSEHMSAEIFPRLIAEAIGRQDWDVDTISGATQTTVAFRRAMVYALRQSEQG